MTHFLMEQRLYIGKVSETAEKTRNTISSYGAYQSEELTLRSDTGEDSDVDRL